MRHAPDPEDDRVSTRQPPWSEEAEQSLLGSLLQDNSALAVVSDLVSEASFYAHANRLIFGAIFAMVSERRPADIVTVFERLRSTSEADEFGGLPYLNGLEACVSHSGNARQYAEIIAERAAERALISGMDEAVEVSWDSRSPLPDRIERISAVLQHVERQRKGPSTRRVPFVPLAGLQAASRSVRWLVKHVIPAESIGLLFGGSGTFKSFIALDLAAHVAHGLPWMGRKTAQGPVIYIAAEGGAGMWPRIDAWHRARRLKWEKCPLYVVPAAIDLGVDAWRVVDAAQLAGVVPALVIVDTLSQTFSGEENSANDVAAYLRELGARFRQLWGCSVLVVHHSGHQATERPRGSSSLRANVDFMFGVFRDEGAHLATVECHKQKDGERFEEAQFSVARLELGTDEDGDPISSLVASHVSSGAEALELVQAEAANGRKGRNAVLLELARDGQPEKELRSAFYDAIDATEPEARKKAWQRSLLWAARNGVLAIQNGTVTILRPIK